MIMNQDLLQGLNIFLIGMMGSGKTTIGQRLAQKLEYRFFDTDVLIEQVTKQTINDLFATEGEEGFRAIETQVLQQIASYTRSVIATGGGIILRRTNWGHLQQGLIVWLDPPIDLIVERLETDTSRPLLKNTDLRAKLTDLMEQRRSLYSQADLHLPISGNHTPEAIATQILEKIPTVLKTKQVTPPA